MTAARKFLADWSKRAATRLKCFSLLKNRSAPAQAPAEIGAAKGQRGQQALKPGTHGRLLPENVG